MTTALQTYEALMEHEILGHRLTREQREGVDRELNRLESIRHRSDREEKLLARYRKAAVSR